MCHPMCCPSERLWHAAQRVVEQSWSTRKQYGNVALSNSQICASNEIHHSSLVLGWAFYMGASSHVRNEKTFLVENVGTNTMRGKLPSVFRARWAFIYMDISALKCLDILFFILFDTAVSPVSDVWVQNTPKLDISNVKSPLSVLKIINIQVFI